MKITIDIPDDIKKEVFELLTSRIAENIFTERYSYDKNIFKTFLKDAVNKIVKERADEIVERCIPYASEYIGKKCLKKLVDQLGKTAD